MMVFGVEAGLDKVRVANKVFHYLERLISGGRDGWSRSNDAGTRESKNSAFVLSQTNDQWDLGGFPL